MPSKAFRQHLQVQQQPLKHLELLHENISKLNASLRVCYNIIN